MYACMHVYMSEQIYVCVDACVFNIYTIKKIYKLFYVLS